MRYFVLYLLIFFSLTSCGDDSLLGVLPSISSVTNEKGKAEGPISGKTVVTIRGTHFADDAVVTFGGLKATAVAVKNETTLVATTDSVILSELVSVSVTTGGQIVVKPEAFVYTPLISFASNRTGSFQIFTMEMDGNTINSPAPAQLTNTGGINESPVFSPDGKKILFSTNRTGDFELFVMEQDGKNPLNLTKAPGIDQEASFSPDGKQIVFVSKRLNGAKNPESDFEIFLMDRDGTNLKQLTTNSTNDRNPSFSPDGNQILFSSDGGGDREIFLMNTDGTGVPLQLTDNGTFDDDPIFSPDGKQVVFVSNPNRTVGNEIHVIDTDGGNPLQLTTNQVNVATPSFLEVPTHGIELLFSADPTKNNREIFVMSCSGDQTRAITNCDEAGVTSLSLNSNSETTPSPSP